MAKRRGNISKQACRRAIFEMVQNRHYWKKPTRKVCVRKRVTADTICKAITYFAGGCEIKKKPCGYQVGSKGYYHYIGA